MRRSIVFKMFINTFLLIVFSIVAIFFIQDYLINDVYITYKINNISQHIFKTAKSLEQTDSITSLGDDIIKEVERSAIFKKTNIQLYDSSWIPQFKWINNQLLSSYYIEYDDEIYKYSFDKYTNRIYEKKKLKSDISKEEIQKMIVNGTSKNIEFETVWTYDPDEFVYIVENSDNVISIKIMYDHFDLNDSQNDHVHLPSFDPNVVEIKGEIISTGYNSSLDFGYAYILKLMNEKIHEHIINEFDEIGKNNLDFEIMNETDLYTGIPYNIFMKSVNIGRETYKLVYFTSYDNLNFLNPFNRSSIVVFIIALCISIVLSIVYTSIITKPILQIRNVTKSLSKLDFSVKCDIHTNDEIEDLGYDINQMANQLEINTLKLNRELEKMKEIEAFRKLFIAAASHEFRTPLTIMKGITEGYKDGMLIYKKEYLNTMEFEIMELENIVDEIITISKNEIKSMNYNFEHFQLSDIVQINLNRYQYILDSRNIIIEKTLDDGFIFADEEKISLVIKNVVSNAIKYSPDDSVIYLSVKENDKRMRFSVENRGSKLNEDTIEMLWEPFYREEENQSKIKGFGIGLYTSKLILTAHNSNFELKNVEDGVMFYCEFKKIEG